MKKSELWMVGPSGQDLTLEQVTSQVGPGWRQLVEDLVEDLISLGWDGELRQIKEKYGGLRFYIGANTGAINERIERAENESLCTCELCGEAGKPRPGGWVGWVRTLCEIHHHAEEKKRKR